MDTMMIVQQKAVVKSSGQMGQTAASTSEKTEDTMSFREYLERQSGEQRLEDAASSPSPSKKKEEGKTVQNKNNQDEEGLELAQEALHMAPSEPWMVSSAYADVPFYDGKEEPLSFNADLSSHVVESGKERDSGLQQEGMAALGLQSQPAASQIEDIQLEMGQGETEGQETSVLFPAEKGIKEEGVGLDTAAPAEEAEAPVQTGLKVAGTQNKPETPLNAGSGLPETGLGETAGARKERRQKGTGAADFHEAAVFLKDYQPAGPASWTGLSGAIFTAGRTQKSSASLRTSPAALPEDLGQVLSAKLTGREQVLELELEPASLGKITIRAAYEDGKTHITILASDPKTMELLNQHAEDLGSILESRTGQETFVYTSELYQESAGNGSSYGRERDNPKEQPRDKRKSDSFAQQLRLGLV